MQPRSEAGKTQDKGKKLSALKRIGDSPTHAVFQPRTELNCQDYHHNALFMKSNGNLCWWHSLPLASSCLPASSLPLRAESGCCPSFYTTPSHGSGCSVQLHGIDNVEFFLLFNQTAGQRYPSTYTIKLSNITQPGGRCLSNQPLPTLFLYLH